MSEPLPDPGADDIGRFHGPAAGAPETERLAALRVYPHTGTSRRRVLDFLGECGATGATDEEVGIALRMRWRSVAPRRNELMNGGWVEDSGLRRPTESGASATVWRLTKRGRREWRWF
jgi:hypothetical protein